MTPNELENHRKLRSSAMKTTRENAGISKVELSKAAGITRQTIDRIERGGTWGVDVEILYLHVLGMAHFQPVYGQEGGRTVVVKMVLVPLQK